MDIFEYLFKNIDALSIILIYFIPGALAQYIFNFVRKNSTKKKDNSNFIFNSIIISGILYLMTSWIWKLVTVNNLWKTIIVAGIAILISYIFSLLLYYGKLDKIISLIGIRQTNNSFWNDAFENISGSYIQFDVDELRYKGSIEYLEEFDNGKAYFTIVNVVVHNKSDSTKVITLGNDKRMVFCSDNVSNIIIKNEKIEKRYNK